jgi:hypothetical protein
MINTWQTRNKNTLLIEVLKRIQAHERYRIWNNSIKIHCMEKWARRKGCIWKQLKSCPVMGLIIHAEFIKFHCQTLP